jgi:phosphoglycerate dehydrogenase-like enzyme
MEYAMDKRLQLLVLTAPIFDPEPEHYDAVRRVAPDIEITVHEGRSAPAEAFVEPQIIFGWPSVDRLKDARELRWLHLPSAGADRYADRSNFVRDDVIISASKGVFSVPIAEHVMAMMLAFSRNMPLYWSQKLQAQWRRVPPAGDVAGSTVGILGLGHIGLEVARRAHAFGASVIAVKRTPGEKPEFVDELYDESGTERVVERSDSLVLCLPSTERTRGFLSADRIARLKDGAFVYNIGRGTAIDQDALIRALESGRLGGAGLDVTDPEPLPEDSPLWAMPNVIITPHSSGSSPTNDKRRFEVFCDNLERFRSGRPLEKLVDFKAGY